MSKLHSYKKTRAWVVFSKEADLPWLKLLRRGFRHCFVVLKHKQTWITLDPLSGHMEVSIHDLPIEYDLPLWLKNQGYTVMPADITQRDKQAPCMPFSCVEAVKRVLGIHSYAIWTPWQLYKFLRQQQSVKTFQPQSLNLKGDFAWEA